MSTLRDYGIGLVSAFGTLVTVFCFSYLCAWLVNLSHPDHALMQFIRGISGLTSFIGFIVAFSFEGHKRQQNAYAEKFAADAIERLKSLGDKDETS